MRLSDVSATVTSMEVANGSQCVGWAASLIVGIVKKEIPVLIVAVSCTGTAL
jgi:hypothetical protein